MFKLYYTKQFKKDARKLNDATRDKLDKALDLLAENPRHPFLDTHKNHRWGAHGRATSIRNSEWFGITVPGKK